MREVPLYTLCGQRPPPALPLPQRHSNRQIQGPTMVLVVGGLAPSCKVTYTLMR